MRADRTSQFPEIAVIGFGNWGSSLVEALLGAGLPLREIVVHRLRPRQSTRWRPMRVRVTAWQSARLDAKILWLCVPDRAIERVAAQLAARDSLGRRIVVHSSGVLSADALKMARGAGAEVAAIHPVMTFPSRRPVPLQGVPFGVEAASSTVRRVLGNVIRQVGVRPFAIRSTRKSLYHAAGTLASPLLVSAVAAAIETARTAGLTERDAMRVVHTLSEATLRNVFARGPRNSFSGPFSRGDAATVKLHLQALSGHPILADVYRSLARHAIESLPVRNRRELTQAMAEAETKQIQRRPGTSRQKQKRMRNLRADS
jgi:predicted short-subunit dehydrogenase-like oxidoreductase (DUF2520 family)